MEDKHMESLYCLMRQKGRDLTQSYDKRPNTHRKKSKKSIFEY